MTTSASTSSTDRLVLELRRQPLDDRRYPADHVASALELEVVLADRLAEEADRLAALALGEVGPQLDEDLGRVRAREQKRELLLRDAAGEARVEDDRADVLRVVEPRRPGLAVLDREVEDLLLELRQDLLAGRARRRRLLVGREPLPFGPLRRRRGRGAGLLQRRLGLALEQLLGLDRGLVEEGRRPEQRPGSG